MDNETYSLVVEQLSCIMKDCFSHLNILDEAANSILLRISKMSLNDEHLRSTINALYPRVIDDLFSNYRNIAYRYCLNRTSEYDLSNDIAQKTIYLLITSKQSIPKPEYWIRKVAHNLLCEHYKTLKHEQKLYLHLLNEATLIQQIISNSEGFCLIEHEQSIPSSVLNGKSYASYLKLKEYHKLTDYAKANNISYEAAKSISKKIMRNVKAEILLALGWQASPDILDYGQYKAIQCFIRYLLATIRDKETGQSNLHKLHPDMPSALDGYKSVEDWSISMFGERRFRLFLMHLGTAAFPLMTTIIVSINNRNHVQVESCKRNQHVGSHNIPANMPISKEKGRSLWPYDRIISLLGENNR